MKKSHYLFWTMTFLFAFVFVHVSAIFYIANETESEVLSSHTLHTPVNSNTAFTNLDHNASKPLAIN